VNVSVSIDLLQAIAAAAVVRPARTEKNRWSLHENLHQLVSIE
jgi:hypothetical protein